MTDVIRLEIERGLATITLDRPEAANAVNGEMKSQLLEALLQVHADAEVRAVLILAEGKNFCVGQDLGEHAAALDADPAHAMDTVEAHYNPIVTALSTLSVPVVVGIGGAASGPGWESRWPETSVSWGLARALRRHSPASVWPVTPGSVMRSCTRSDLAAPVA